MDSTGQGLPSRRRSALVDGGTRAMAAASALFFQPHLDQGFMTRHLIVRVLILCGVLIQFMRHGDPPESLLALFAIYVIGLTAIWFVHPERFASKRSQALQVALDSILYSLLIAFSTRPETSLFLLYCFPLMLAASSMRRRGVVVAFGWVAACYLLALLSHAPHGDEAALTAVFGVYVPTLGFLAVVTAAWAFRHHEMSEMASENARLLAISDRHSRLLEGLSKAMIEVTGLQNPAEVIASIPAHAAGLLGGQTAGLYLRDERVGDVCLAASWQMPENLYTGPISEGIGVIGRIIASGKPLVVPDYRHWPDRDRALDGFEIVGVVGAPVTWHGQVKGVILVHDRRTGHQFESMDADALVQLGNVAAIALDNTQRIEELERLNDSAIDAIVLIDDRGRILKANRETESVLGYAVSELIGRNVVTLYRDADRARDVNQQLHASPDGRVRDLDTVLHRQDGTPVPVRLSASLLHDYQNRHIGSVGFFRDLSRIRHVQQRLVQLSELTKAGKAVAVAAQGGSRKVLDAIVQNAMSTFDDVGAIVIYEFDGEAGEFRLPPACLGLRHPERMLTALPADAPPRRLVASGEAYFASQAATDPMMRGDFVDREGIVASAGLPLVVEADHLVGVMFINYRNPHQFDDEEKSIAGILANLAAIAIRDAALIETIQRDSREKELVAMVSQRVGASAGLKDKLDAILDAIHPHIQYSAAQINLLNPSRERIEVLGSAGDPYYTVAAGGFYALGEGYTGHIIEHDDPLLIPDVRSSTRVQPRTNPPERPFRSFVGVPFRAADDRRGTIELVHSRPNAFSDDHLRLLALIGRTAAVSVPNAQLFERVQGQARQLDMVAEIARRISSMLVLDDLLAEAARLIGEGLKYTVNIGLYDGEEVLFHAYAAYGFGPNLPSLIRVKTGVGITGWVAQNRQPLRVPDVGADLRFVPGHPDTRSELALPIQHKGRFLGILNVESPSLNGFDEIDERILGAVAGQLAVAIYMIRRTEAFERIEATRVIAEFERAIAALRHAIVGRLGMIRNHLKAFELDRDDFGKLAEIEHITRQVQDIDIPEIGGEVEPVDIGAVFRVLARSWMKDRDPSIPLALNIDPSLDAFADVSRHWMVWICKRLLENATGFAANAASPTIVVNFSVENQRLRFDVVDNGPGVSAAVLPRLFARPIPKVADEPGMGIALFWTRQILTAYDGTIELTDARPGHTTFTFRLPRSAAHEVRPAPWLGPHLGRLLVISDDRRWRAGVDDALASRFNLSAVDDTAAARAWARREAADGEAFQAIVIDAQIASDSLEVPKLAGQLRERYPSARIVVVSAAPSWRDQKRVDCSGSGADEYLSKVVDPSTLRLALETSPQP
jgi:PAS domain S-box-containing protein